MAAEHDLVNALVQVIGDALPGVQVLDGWNGKTDLADQVVVVAFSPTAGSPDITTDVVFDDGSLCDYLESTVIMCTGAVWDGNMEFTAKRDQLGQMIESIRTALKADPKLSGVAYDTVLLPSRQWFSDVQQSTKDSPARANVQCDFQVRVQVYV